MPTQTAGGWCYAPRGLDSSSVVYSLGVGDNFDFDTHLVSTFGLELHAFDPTPASIALLSRSDLPGGFHHHPWAVAAADGPLVLYPRRPGDGQVGSSMLTVSGADGAREEAIEVAGYTLSTIVRRLGHERVDLLKVDIEGSEYEVVASLIDSDLRPRQILVEFHHRFSGIPLDATRRAVARLRDAGYGLFAVSDTGRELSFIHSGAGS